jgi:hypothetical protein
MPTKRGVKGHDEQPIRVYYGINPHTLTVEQFWLSRDRKLTGLHEGNPVSHYTLPPRDASSELVTVFGLIYIVELPPMSNLWENDQIKALEERAAALRAGRDATE